MAAESSFDIVSQVDMDEVRNAVQMTQKELEVVKSNLAAVGIPIEIRYETNWSKLEQMMGSMKTPIFRYAWYTDIPDPDNIVRILFHSRSTYNYMGYHRPEVDELLDRANKELDLLKRIDLYRKAEEMIMEDAPIVPTINHVFRQAYQPYVKGIEVNALGGPYIPMKRIWLKKD